MRQGVSLSAIDLVRRFRGLRALVVGDAMLDSYLEGEVSRLCREGPVPVVRKTLEQRVPGGAANSAANLRALEANVTLLGVVGRDLPASLLRTALRKRGVDTRWLIEDETIDTLHKTRILAGNQYVVRFDEGSEGFSFSAETQHRLLECLEELWLQNDVIVISDYHYGVVSDAMVERLRELQTKYPRTLLVDAKVLQRFRDVPATVMTPDYAEAWQLLGFLEGQQGRYDERLPDDTHGQSDIEHVTWLAHQLHTELACEHLAITLGGHGVLLRDRRGHVEHLPAHQVAQANDVGAGDSFAAALALALAAGGGMTEAARIAIDAASIVVARPRTAVVPYQELLQRVSLRVYTTQVQAASSAGRPGASPLERLAAQLEVERILGHTIVFTNGVFDILHAGHVEFLRQAKALGDVLVVAVNSDRSARRLKGPGRPINCERDRLALVAALDMVDHAVLFDEDTPTMLIRSLRPHVHVKGGDYVDAALPETEAVQAGGGRVVILPLVGSVSTSSVIERIVTLANGRSKVHRPDPVAGEAGTHTHMQGGEHD